MKREGLIVTYLRLTFGWLGSPKFWRVFAAAAENVHGIITLESAWLLDEEKEMMARVKVVEAWEEGKTTTVPPYAKFKPHPGVRKSDPFLTTVHIDDLLLVRVRQADTDRSPLVASASFASECVRLFRPPVEDAVTPIFAPKKSTDWDTTMDALGSISNSHTLRIHFPRQKPEATNALLYDRWSVRRRRENARDELSVADKLRNHPYVVRAGRYCVWEVLELTALSDSDNGKQLKHSARFNR